MKRTTSIKPIPWQLGTLALFANLICVACGGSDVIDASGDTSAGSGGNAADSTTSTGQGGSTTSVSTSAATTTTTTSTGAGGSDEPVEPPDDPFGPDPSAVITLDAGDVSTCMPGLLTGGSAAAYAGFAGASDGAYFLWRNKWEESNADLRIETWDSFGGATAPGTYVLTENDTNYVDCAVCIFLDAGESGAFWPKAGDSVTFTSLTTGPNGIGKELSGTFTGTLGNENCSAEVTISFTATANDMSYGPL